MKPTALKFMSLVCKKLSENSQDTPLLVWNHFCEAQTVTKLHYLLASNFLRARRRHLDRVSCTLLSRCARKCPQKYSFPARLVASAAVKEACCCWLHFECKPDISADVTGIKYYSCPAMAKAHSSVLFLCFETYIGAAARGVRACAFLISTPLTPQQSSLHPRNNNYIVCVCALPLTCCCCVPDSAICAWWLERKDAEQLNSQVRRTLILFLLLCARRTPTSCPTFCGRDWILGVRRPSRLDFDCWIEMRVAFLGTRRFSENYCFLIPRLDMCIVWYRIF